MNQRYKIAVIGSGISGLVSAYLLNKKHDVTLFEKNDYLGGHTHTHEILDGNNILNVDSGFIVYNENTYPNFIKLLDELEVDRQMTTMGFSVKSNHKDFEYSGNSLNSVFSQRRNLFNPQFLRMLWDISRFNKKAINDIDNLSLEKTLDEYLKENSYSSSFINNYIIPMGSAIWSTSPRMMVDMPALFFIKFFNNHGLLKISNRPQWWVVKNGSNQYVKKIIDRSSINIKLSSKIKSINREHDKVQIATSQSKYSFDKVVIATHSDQALKLLANPTSNEKNILGNIKYQKNTALIHTDTSILPNRNRAWSSWNYLLGNQKDEAVILTYNMNILQNLKSNLTYCVTINNNQKINKNKIIKEIVYHHPLFTIDSVRAQQSYDKINGFNNTFFCGAYWGNGFHEDGVNSALKVCSKFNLSL